MTAETLSEGGRTSLVSKGFLVTNGRFREKDAHLMSLPWHYPMEVTGVKSPFEGGFLCR